MKLPISIITVVYNNVVYIRDAIESVLSQDYSNVEYILIDGGSTDGTLDVINEYQDRITVVVSEPDKGIYDALNKGVRLSTCDVIGILHSDDLFADDHVISDSVNSLEEAGSDICFSDLVIVRRDNIREVVRHYKSLFFKRWLLRFGWMPPHPTMFIRKSLYYKVGLYSEKYKIAGDFDFLVKAFYLYKAKFSMLNRVTVIMRLEGVSNSGFASKCLINREINRSLHENKVWSIYPMLYIRYLFRLFEYI